MVVVACGLVNFDGKFFVSNLSIPMLLCKEYLKLFRATLPKFVHNWRIGGLRDPFFFQFSLQMTWTSLSWPVHMKCSDVFGNKH